MNLFVTDTDPVICAMNLDDKRVGKLLMECNQMMSLALKTHWEDNSYVFWETRDELTSGWSHLNHPVSIWVRESIGNYEWTLAHAKALAQEWEFRFGSSHGSARRLTFLEREYPLRIPRGALSPFQNSARNSQIDFTYLPVPYSYRHYLHNRWQTDKLPVKFTGRQEPAWRHIL